MVYWLLGREAHQVGDVLGTGSPRIPGILDSPMNSTDYKFSSGRRELRLINATLEFLGQLRRDGLSAQTYNHYLKAAKQFTRWLVRDRRTAFDPLAHLSG